jgi:hypothetical protein
MYNSQEMQKTDKCRQTEYAKLKIEQNERH